MLILGPFPWTKTKYKLLWNSKKCDEHHKTLKCEKNKNKKHMLTLLGNSIQLGEWCYTTSVRAG